MMVKPLVWSFLLFARLVLCHGGHHDSAGPAPGETIQQYAQRHMVKEHHIDSFDIRSFFHLHDLNGDGFWDKDEIQAIYGVHHIYSQKKSKDDAEHQKKADHIVATVLSILDLNKDDKISPEELEKVGLAGLPNFDNMGAEGHHYDVESEFFLHHEEEFHSTPETQTDEAYTHPEDLEHFAHHEEIERKEVEREAEFQGLSVDEIVQAQLAAAEAAEKAAASAAADSSHESPVAGGEFPIAPRPLADQANPKFAKAQVPVETPSKPKVTRITPPEKQEPEVKYRSAKEEGMKSAEWGAGPAGYQAPIKPAEKMRKNVPYKYKFRRNWGDF